MCLQNRTFIAVIFILSALTMGANNAASINKSLKQGIADSLSIGKTSISFNHDILMHDMDISISSVDSTALPTLDYGMFNVSDQGEGYRFLPHGTHFSGEGATVVVKYDRTRIPSGYTEDDIRTYYYDTQQKCWVALQRITVDKQNSSVISQTTHFTDMINGVIVAPESPETSAFTPTMMNDIKAADPTSKINIIAPPTANNRGSANLQYPFEMPPARNGMQPHVALSYNSDGGSGWAGEGWDVSIPTISVDTRWGVPRYNEEFESETYLLNGQMLAMMNGNEMTVAHRQDSIPRKADRQFFIRQGGDFSKIIRKGNNPSNYSWEITDRNGVVYTYGDSTSHLNGELRGTYKDIHGDSKIVVAEWKLTSVKETHGDYMMFQYENCNETALGELISKAVYLKTIETYQNGYDGVLTKVSFGTLAKNGTISLKSVQSCSARYGFITSSNRLLGSVEISFRNELLRKYLLDYYIDTTFHKDALKKVSHVDNLGSIISYQEFDYYDDVCLGQNNTFNAYSTNNEEWKNENGHSFDGFSKFIETPIHYTKPTGLGGTKIESIGTSLYAGVGSIAGIGKDNTAGMSFGYNQSTSKGEAAFIDLNGDGLPDMLYRTSSGWSYSPLTIDNGAAHFGELTEIRTNGISLPDFSKSKTSSITGGVKEYFIQEAGTDALSSTTKTTNYFADVNGDGLIDLVANGKVYFNHIENGVPTFSLSSTETPSPINNSGNIDVSKLQDLAEDSVAIASNSPMQDVVRYWEAPFDGYINISSTVQYIIPNNANCKDFDEDLYSLSDGVRVAIQVGNTEKWFKHIDSNDDNEYQTTLQSVNVSAGDRVYFRLQCGNDSLSNGDYDRVKWLMNIEYIDAEDKSITDITGQSTISYSSSNTYRNTSAGEAAVGDNYTISSTLYKQATNDDVRLDIYFTSNEDSESILDEDIPVLSHVIFANETYDGSFDIDLPSDCVNGILRFEVSSNSNIDWSSLSWDIHVKDIVTIDEVNDTTTFNFQAQQNIYNKLLRGGSKYTTYKPESAQFSVTFKEPVTGEIHAVIKTDGDVFNKRTYYYDNGNLLNDTAFIIPKNKTVSIECFVPDYEFAKQISEAYVCFHQQPIGELYPVDPIADAFVYSISAGDDLGTTYRGWGQFVYNASNGRYARTINESNLHFASDTTKRELYNPLSMPITLLTPKNDDSSYFIGAKEDIYIHGDTISCARLGENNVNTANLFNSLNSSVEFYNSEQISGTSARGPILVTKSKSNDVMVSGGVPFASLSGNAASGSNTTQNAFVDMNGDGYPDIITKHSIQYTTPWGGYNNDILDRDSKLSLSSVEKEQESNNTSFGIGVGGQTIFSHSKKSEISIDHSKAATSISGDASWNKDNIEMAYMDINGDGLPDLLSVSEDKLNVRLNLGYYFTEKFEISNIKDITGSKSTIASLGLGGSFNIAHSSFSGGLGLASSTNNEKSNFIDINGDGLPDKVRADDGTLYVAFNRGNCFDHEIAWSDVEHLEMSTSTSLSENIAATITIPIPLWGIKIAINPGVSHTSTLSRPRFELRDVTGDGYLDIVSSNEQNILNVRRSNIRRTNKLKSVSNSLGGTFTIDYKHSTPTYGLPGGKWVMSSVDVDYGFNDMTKLYIPHSKTIFEYNNGQRDRHEREFLGFGEVVSKQLDTEQGDAVYRQNIERYDVQSIYTAGNLVETAIANAGNDTIAKVENAYYRYTLTNASSTKYNGGSYKYSTSFDYWNDRGAAYTPLKYTKTIRYDGNTAGTIMSEAYKTYYVRNGDHGLLRTHKYSDKGGLHEDGKGRCDYVTSIQYKYNLSGSKYIFGLPYKVTVNSNGNLYHDVEASYDLNYPNHLTQIKRMISAESLQTQDAGEVGPIFPRDNATTNSTNSSFAGDNIVGPTGSSYPDQESENVVSYRNAKYAITNYTYDQYGNIRSVTFPTGSDSKRYSINYKYENQLHTYIDSITDAIGLKCSEPSHDYRYGVTTHAIDRNAQNFKNGYDNLGRLIYVRSPFDTPAEGPGRNTMAFSYNSIAQASNGNISIPANATTTYYFRYTEHIGEDVYERTDSMRVVTFVDGFGRLIQVRKDGVIWEDNTNKERTVVDGRVGYDAFGRAVKAYYPSSEDAGSISQFNPRSQSNEFFTKTGYDILDRKTTVQLPDGTSTNFIYALSDNTLKTKTIDANGHESDVYSNGSGKQVKSVQFIDGKELVTTFEYDGIGRLVTVTDADGNKTLSDYDMADNRISVNHPASGITTFSYDALGNVITKQTANLKAADNAKVTYNYDYGRLVGIHYPEHPENDVVYHYGTATETDTHLRGRVKFREDGSGGTEYHYDAMGNVSQLRRTVVVPGTLVCTADFSWTYDNYGKLLDMTYPPVGNSSHGEKVVYHYDRSGQLQSIYNGKTSGYHYVQTIGYDRFGDRVHMQYGNGSVADYTYKVNNRRLDKVLVSKNGNDQFDFERAYSYDSVGNITSIMSTGNNLQFPAVSHDYRYDALDRLILSKSINETGSSSSYYETYAYDDMYRMTKKTQALHQKDIQFTGDLYAGYTLKYQYNQNAGKRFQMSSVSDVNYRTLSAPSASDKITEGHTFKYDNNGNITHIATSRKRLDKTTTNLVGEQRFRWDEENRLLALSQNGYVSHYFYDADGERTVKMHGGSQAVFVNSERNALTTTPLQFTAYFNPYFSIHDGTSITKHLYIGSERIASMTGQLSENYTDVANNNNIIHAGLQVGVTAQSMLRSYGTRKSAMVDSLAGNYAYFELPNALENVAQQNQTLALLLDNDDSDSSNGEQSTAYQIQSTSNTQQQSYGGYIWYFHKDHLGSSTLITNGTGAISQQVEYLPYGEVFLEKQMTSSEYHTPYKFNGKELDEETGLYYYGARYMNPRLSIWYGTDRLEEKYPNISSYAYCAGNPVNLFDFQGNFPILINGRCNGSERGNSTYWDNRVLNTISKKTGYSKQSFYYVNGNQSWVANERVAAGYKKGKLDANYVYNRLKASAKNNIITEQVQVITHSRGAAFGNGYIKSLTSEIEKLARRDGLSFAYNPASIVEYSVNIAPHQSGDLNYDYSGTMNVMVSHIGDILSTAQAQGDVINIRSYPETDSWDQHGNASYNTELGVILNVLENITNKRRLQYELKKAYDNYDAQRANRTGSDNTRVEYGK